MRVHSQPKDCTSNITDPEQVPSDIDLESDTVDAQKILDR
jgi:hypothetical protein